MRRTSFSLVPFSGAGLPPGAGIIGATGRNANKFTIRYELLSASKVAVPAPVDAPARMDRLWENTCFEFFLCPKNSDSYWEFNLSPAGQWNVYRFSSYRQGMQVEQAFTALPFSVIAEPDSLVLALEADLTTLISSDEAVDAGISAVVRLIDGTFTYWALAHPGPEPDFHRRDGFILEL